MIEKEPLSAKEWVDKAKRSHKRGEYGEAIHFCTKARSSRSRERGTPSFIVCGARNKFALAIKGENRDFPP